MKLSALLCTAPKALSGSTFGRTWALGSLILAGLLAAPVASATGSGGKPPPAGGVEIRYNEYSRTPSIGRGVGTSTDPRDPGYGAMRFFIENVKRLTKNADGGQVTFVPDQSISRGENALRAGVQFGRNTDGVIDGNALFDNVSWGFIYNSWPFGLRFEQALEFLYHAKFDLPGGGTGNGIALAQRVLKNRGGTQVVFPVIGSTAQVSGYFPQPIGPARCNPGDRECRNQRRGIGLEGICTSGWAIRYLEAPQDTLAAACGILVERGIIPEQTLLFYPPVGGQSVLIPSQRRAIQGFEFTVSSDDVLEFFEATTADLPPGSGPDDGDLNCEPELPRGEVVAPGTERNCDQNVAQAGARYAHTTSWHQPYLLAWIHIDKKIWFGLSDEQRQAIALAAKQSVRQSFNATDSIQCERLKDILDFNNGIKQRNTDGSIRRITMDSWKWWEKQGQRPVSADVTLATWPQEALDVLLEGRNRFFGQLESEDPEFGIIWDAARGFAEMRGYDQFDPAPFPSANSQCDVVSKGGPNSYKYD